ncbi:MAG: hypothetical protein ACYTFY_23395, partial [Planctomycetota bacterium]
MAKQRAEEKRINITEGGKHMFIPSMCPIGARLMAGVFRSAGYNALPLEIDEEALAIGYKHTAGGECVPCPCTTGSIIKVMQERDIKPEDVIFFMPTACGPCRFGQYAKLNEIIFEKMGWSDIQILSLSAENAYGGIELATRKKMYYALIAADIIRKFGMRIRPYEREKGQADLLVEDYTAKFEAEFAKTDSDIEGLLAKMTEDAKRIEVDTTPKPLVGVVGEIYVRTDPFINMNLCRRIEELGGEAWLAPISEWILYTSECSRMVAKDNRDSIFTRIKLWFEDHWFNAVEKRYYDIVDPILHDRREPHIPEIMDAGEKYLPKVFEGEAILTLGRAELFVKRNGAKAIVNASPMFCMPGTITTSIFPKLEQDIG